MSHSVHFLFFTCNFQILYESILSTSYLIIWIDNKSYVMPRTFQRKAASLQRPNVRAAIHAFDRAAPAMTISKPVQYSSTSMMVRTRVVFAGSAGSPEPNSMAAS